MNARGVLYAALVLTAVLHQDFWLWNDARMVLGLPVGLTYHVVYCLAVAVLMALLVRYAWPTQLDAGDTGDDAVGT